MITIEPATKETIENFKYDGIEKEMLDKIDWRGQLKTYAQIGRVWHVKDEVGSILMLYGLFECSKGVLNSWMLFKQSASLYAKSIAKELKKHLKEELKTYHRVQTYIFSGDRASRYVELFGLQYEATLRAFGPNKENADIYSAVRV